MKLVLPLGKQPIRIFLLRVDLLSGNIFNLNLDVYPMLTWGLLLIRLGLAFFVYLSLLIGQIDLLDDFDPEQSIPESDFFILSTAQNLHKGLTAQSAHLLIQLSILTKEEINALDSIVNGKASVQIKKHPRLSKIIKTLWPKEISESITGAILYKMNIKDDIQYKWSGEVNLHNINIGFLGERDGYEKKYFGSPLIIYPKTPK